MRISGYDGNLVISVGRLVNNSHKLIQLGRKTEVRSLMYEVGFLPI